MRGKNIREEFFTYHGGEGKYETKRNHTTCKINPTY
jgi:hypothetical protein